MKYELKGNPNYCATITQIDNLIPLENCDNIQGTHIFGNHVIVSKDIEIGSTGVFFPVGTSIKQTFLSSNNLYRDKVLNTDKEKAGFFELNGRVRCMKLRGHKSEGFWIPIDSLNYIIDNYVVDLPETTIGLEFDHINDIMICEKYIVKTEHTQEYQQSRKDKKNKKLKRRSKLLDNQFRFHVDTSHFGKNIHKFNLDTMISITEKLHGTSFIVSNILCKKQLSFKDRIAKLFKVNVGETEYSNIYASRNVVKNQYIENVKVKSFEQRYAEISISSKKRKVEDFFKEKYNIAISAELYRKIFPDDTSESSAYYSIEYFESFDQLKGFKDYLWHEFAKTGLSGYYSEDIWKTVNEELKQFLTKGVTIYGECVGYLKNGGYIQKGYDYGCDPGKHAIYIYRITSTDADGKVFEWSMLQVQQWCKEKGLKAVPLHYYGTVENLLSKYNWEYADSKGNELENWRNSFLNLITELYLEKKCYICKNDVPNEGVVLRLETLDIQSYKHKSFLFKARESKEADEGISNIEDDQSQEVI